MTRRQLFHTHELPRTVHLTFVTGNPGKLREAQTLLGDVADIRQDADGYTEPQADTLEEVARAGLAEVGRRLEPPFFLEDAGLFVTGLADFPGVYSAHAFKTIGWPGILKLLADQPETSERGARFEAVVALRDVDGSDHLFKGTCEGHIAPEARGSHGFGFDPIFVPDGTNGRTFAELDPAEKGDLSHRGAAMAALRTHLETRMQRE